MFKGAENGHFSRYAFYTFDYPQKWQSHRPTQKSRFLDESIRTASDKLCKLYNILSSRERSLYIDLTESHWQNIDDTFKRKMNKIEELGLSKHLHASNNRAAVMALRIASMFAVLRKSENDINALSRKKRITPTTANINAALLLADNFIKHAIKLYYTLPMSNNPDAKGVQYEKFIHKLPNKFKTADAYEIANKMELNISNRQLRRWLKNNKNIIRIKKGHYEKRT